MGKLLLKQDEMILLKNSEAVKNIETYGNMYDCVMPVSYTHLTCRRS